MSMYGDDKHGICKNELYNIIKKFLEVYDISALLEVVIDVNRYDNDE